MHLDYDIAVGIYSHSILQLQVGSQDIVFMKVDWYRTIKAPYPGLRYVQRVQVKCGRPSTLMVREWVPAHLVDTQVFFSKDNTPAATDVEAAEKSNYNLVHGKRSSDYKIPQHQLHAGSMQSS